jgi:hypothetical protein
MLEGRKRSGDTMKKALIPAALILTISLAAFPPAPICLADPDATATSILASSWFWRLVDVFRASELSRVTVVAQNGQACGVRLAAADLVTPILFNLVVEQSIALDHKSAAL